MLILIFPLSGCWGIKEIQGQLFVTELGIDYKQGEYVVYFQILSFKSVAKTEAGGESPSDSQVNLGIAKGETIHEAFSNVQKSSQIPLYFGHIKTVYLTESIIKRHMKEALSFLGRNIYMRHATWLYAVQGELKDILLAQSLFDSSPIYTFTYRPEEMLASNSFIPVNSLRTFVSRYYEPVGSTMIPTVTIDKSSWRDKKEKKKLLTISGAYFFSNQEFKGWLKEENLKGMNWFNTKLKRMNMNVRKKKISVQIIHSSTKIQVLKGSSPKFIIVVKTHAILEENNNHLPLSVVKQALQRQIKSDINESFQKGLTINADILNLSEKSYRFHYKNWSELELKYLTKESIADIQVKIHIENSADYKS